MGPADDSELLRRSAAGDRDAFTVFLLRHDDAVHRYVDSLCASSDESEDAVQECFISAWRSAATFRGGSARGWLFTIARNAVNRGHRKRVGEPDSFDSLEELGERAGWGSESSDPLLVLSRRDALDRALETLTSDEREILMLRDVEQFTGPETAEILDLTLAAVKSRLHRGRLKLLAALRALGEVPDA